MIRRHQTSHIPIRVLAQACGNCNGNANIKQGSNVPCMSIIMIRPDETNHLNIPTTSNKERMIGMFQRCWILILWYISLNERKKNTLLTRSSLQLNRSMTYIILMFCSLFRVFHRALREIFQWFILSHSSSNETEWEHEF